jgi:TonB family protein
MKLKKQSVSACCLLVPVCLFMGSAVAFEIPQNATTARVGIDVLRRMATAIVVPVFPKDAIAAGRYGVVVAEVYLDKASRVERVEVLEAPCPSVAASVLEAIRQWKFSSQHSNMNRVGKVVYYFQNVNGMPVVLGAEETPRAAGIRSRVSRDTTRH